MLNTEKQTVTTVLGTGKSGQSDGKTPTFYEPAGLSIADGKLFVADTNNHAIRVVDLKAKEVSTLKIKGLTPPTESKDEANNFSPNANETELKTQKVSVNAANSLVFNIGLPEGYHLNPNAPQRYEVLLENGQNVKIANPKEKFKKLPLIVPFQTDKKGAVTLKAKLTVYYCREDNTGTCLIKTLIWKIPLDVVADKKVSSKVEISANVL
jgi:hypothetical protein